MSPSMRRFLNRVRYNRLISLILRTIGKPVSQISESLALQLRRKVWINGCTVGFDGLDLVFPPDVGVDFATSIYWNGKEGYEPEVWNTLRPILENLTRFADIGANIGFYSVLASRLNAKMQIWAFEPVPKIASKCRKFLAANNADNVKLYELALSDSEGEAVLYLPESSYVEEEKTGTIRLDSWQAKRPNAMHIEVATKTFDSLCSGANWFPQAIKIDVEDFESSVLRGMNDLLRIHRPLIVCEVLPRDHLNNDTLSILKEYEYAIYAITRDGLFKQTSFHLSRRFTDFLFVPDLYFHEYIPYSDMTPLIQFLKK